MTHNPIILSKFVNNIDIDVSMRVDDENKYVISIFDKHTYNILYYQVYIYKSDCSGDFNFEPIPNEFSDGKLFTNAELKSIFDMDGEIKY